MNSENKKTFLLKQTSKFYKFVAWHVATNVSEVPAAFIFRFQVSYPVS